MSRKIYLLPICIILSFILLALFLPSILLEKKDSITLNTIKSEPIKSKSIENNLSTNEILNILSKGEDDDLKSVSEVFVDLDKSKQEIIDNFHTQVALLKDSGLLLSNYFTLELDPKNLHGFLYNITYKNTSKFFLWDIVYKPLYGELKFSYNPVSKVIYEITIEGNKIANKSDGERFILSFGKYLKLGNLSIKEDPNNNVIYGIIKGSEYKIQCTYDNHEISLNYTPFTDK